jgi:hypothetical protein
VVLRCQATLQQVLQPGRGAPVADAAVGHGAAEAPGRLRGLLGDPFPAQALVFTIAGAALGVSMAMLATMRVRGGR